MTHKERLTAVVEASQALAEMAAEDDEFRSLVRVDLDGPVAAALAGLEVAVEVARPAEVVEVARGFVAVYLARERAQGSVFGGLGSEDFTDAVQDLRGYLAAERAARA